MRISPATTAAALSTGGGRVRPRGRPEERRRAIVEAAKSVFLERGYGDASMSEVSARLGGSKQTLYSYFKSKEELFLAVMLEEGADRIRPIIADLRESGDLRGGLTDFAISLLRHYCVEELLAFRRIIYAEGPRSGLGRQFFERGPKRGWIQMAEHFERAMKEGRMRSADPLTAVAHFFGLCEAGPYQRLLEGAATSLSEMEIISTAQSAVDAFARIYEIR